MQIPKCECSATNNFIFQVSIGYIVAQWWLFCDLLTQVCDCFYMLHLQYIVLRLKFWYCDNTSTGVCMVEDICPTVSGCHLAPGIDS